MIGRGIGGLTRSLTGDLTGGIGGLTRDLTGVLTGDLTGDLTRLLIGPGIICGMLHF